MKGTRPASAFLSRDTAASMSSGARSETFGRGPSRSTALAIASQVGGERAPVRRAMNAAPTRPQPTASPWVKRR